MGILNYNCIEYQYNIILTGDGELFENHLKSMTLGNKLIVNMRGYRPMMKKIKMKKRQIILPVDHLQPRRIHTAHTGDLAKQTRTFTAIFINIYL